MKFEEAIAEMRKGKRCTYKGSICTYWIIGDLLMCDSSPTGHQSLNEPFHMLGKDWSIVEPPPPLPRLFRAKLTKGGQAVAGADFASNNDGYRFALTSYPPGSAWWVKAKDIYDIEYIDQCHTA
jgi:hypothetical protein